MNSKELKIFGWVAAIFLVVYYLPVETLRFQGALVEAFRLLKWYAREHVLLCLVPAFFIAGAIGVFVSQNAVMKYFGPKASKWLSYSVASVSGTILSVCSCTVLPLFGGIYMRGAGLGPAVAFLYSGPAINVMAIVLTARLLGWKLGLARAIMAIVFSVVIGLLMQFLFRKEERARIARSESEEGFIGDDDKSERPLWQVVLYFVSMVGILIFANWGEPQEETGIWHAIYQNKWGITALFGLVLAASLWRFFKVRAVWIIFSALPAVVLAFVFPENPVVAFTAGAAGLVGLTFLGVAELDDWRDQTWGFAKQILPLLFAGVLAAGFFLGSPGGANAGVIPNIWIEALVGDSPSALLTLIGKDASNIPGWLSAVWPLWANLFASLAGALMYFATLTEVPILRGLIDSGMGQGPALALLLAGPALSLPSILVLNSILGSKKTLIFVGLVVIMSTISGMVFGMIA